MQWSDSLANPGTSGNSYPASSLLNLLAPLDSPQLADFVAALDPVNAVADTAPGFISV
jgi:hypothetical protein